MLPVLDEDEGSFFKYSTATVSNAVCRKLCILHIFLLKAVPERKQCGLGVWAGRGVVKALQKTLPNLLCLSWIAL